MDVKVICSTADSYIDLAVHGPGCVAETAELAVENLRPIISRLLLFRKF